MPDRSGRAAREGNKLHYRVGSVLAGRLNEQAVGMFRLQTFFILQEFPDAIDTRPLSG